MLKKLKRIIKDINKDQYSNLEKRVAEALDKLIICQNNLLSSSTPALAILEKEAHQRWYELALSEECFMRKRYRVTWVDCGDKNTKFFHRFMAARRAMNQIHYLFDDFGLRLDKLEDI
ncbi:unnamed protein product [Thlaspi arvense]|uniref:Uncharacterized protein n=1 Tax=Thlaspi arvense TaxID=13288 RepID=A0AAU9S8M9_THLAR|nr:unnamed protein product [Thlaspi arvense]